MGGGSSRIPKVDPAIGRAATLSAQTGQQGLAFMKQQATTANNWAKQDRNWFNKNVRPLHGSIINQARTWDTESRREGEAGKARAMAMRAGDQARGATTRTLQAMGHGGSAARAGAELGSTDMNIQLAALGADNAARDNVRATGRAMKMDAASLGGGYQASAQSALGMAGNAGAAGYGTAMQGYGQQGSLLNAQFGQQMDAYGMQSQERNGMWSGLGSVAGAALGFISDENTKKNRKPARGALKALKAMPIDTYDYKPGMGDGGSHVGPMAQDFQRETGQGDGTTIKFQDAIGVTMGAVKELAAEVASLKKPVRGVGRAVAA